MKCLFFKKPSLLRDGITELLRRRFQDSTVLNCDQFDVDQSSDASLFIVGVSEALSHEKEIQALQDIGVKIVLWVEDLRTNEMGPLFEQGYQGYLYYDIDETLLIQAITYILDGKRFVCPTLSDLLIDAYREQKQKITHPPLDLLSKREWDVLQLLVEGYSNIRIADALFLSDKTVKNYVSSILRKLDVPDRTNAVIKALKKQWCHL